MERFPRTSITTDAFLSHCARIARLGGGWVSAKDAEAKGVDASADLAFAAARAEVAVSDEDILAARQARALHATRLASSHRTAFDEDLAEALGLAVVPEARARLVGALMGFYYRVQSPAGQAVAGPPSFHLGHIGERLLVEATVSHISQMPSAWGLTYIVNMVTPQGARLTWFTSRSPLSVGQTATLRATVKDHREFRGQAQTVVTRCTVVAGEAQPA